LGFDYEIDHIIPISKYGNNDPSNLQILCKSCNLKKLNKSSLTSTYEIPFWNADE
jgi:5-methylcytosine-specific restriction endonuclease McrA